MGTHQGMALLATTDGITAVKTGQWVENRREVRSVTLQVFDDINLAATGVIAIRRREPGAWRRCRRYRTQCAGAWARGNDRTLRA